MPSLQIVLCVRCGSEFSSYNPNPKYCSLACKNKSKEASINFAEAVILYESGHTQKEIASILGSTQKAVYGLFKRMGYKCRKAAKRDQSGERNARWKGDDATYSALHLRVIVARGRPDACEWCNAVSGRFEWANLTGAYHDVNDYVRLCCSCHTKFDNQRRNVSGGKSTVNVKRKRS